MGEDLAKLERSQRSTLLSYQQFIDAAGSIDKLLTFRLPTYDLRDFEREVYVSQHTITGDGAAQPNFTFSPNVAVEGEDVLFPKNRSVRILRADIVNDDVVTHNFQLLVARPPGRGVNPIVTLEGLVGIDAGDNITIIGVEGVGFNAASGAFQQLSPRTVELYSNKPGGALADLLNITSLIVLTNLLTLSLKIMWETIPDPVEFGSSLAAVTGSP